jgi:signal transduction histidine kinase
VRRRILTAMIGLVVVSTVILSVVLGVIIRSREQDDTVRELERIAARAQARLDPTKLSDSLLAVSPPSREPTVRIAIYDASHRRVAGRGPAVGDSITRGSGILSTDAVVGDEHVVVQPVVVGQRRVATIRVSEPVSGLAGRIRHDIGILILIDVGALAVAAVVGAMLSSRLTQPLRVIRDDAVRLGSGDFSIVPQHSGIAELDETVDALADTARRLDAVLQRERSFSADASHQLRTPITSIRLAVDTELITPRLDSHELLREILPELDRLESTINTLLAVARDRPRDREPLDVDSFVDGVIERWRPALAREGRGLIVRRINHPDPHVSRNVLDQVIDVLVSNALVHGRGGAEVIVNQDDEKHLVITVSDAGRVERNPSLLFERRDAKAAGHGVGLALARSLAEAEGGRLFLVEALPTTFRLILPDLV